MPIPQKAQRRHKKRKATHYNKWNRIPCIAMLKPFPRGWGLFAKGVALLFSKPVLAPSQVFGVYL